jgi:hypothetical protein
LKLFINYNPKQKKQGFLKFQHNQEKLRNPLIYAKQVNLLAINYAISRKSILLPKCMPIIAKRFNYAEKYTFIAKRFNYAELYQLYGDYTTAISELEPFKAENIFNIHLPKA